MRAADACAAVGATLLREGPSVTHAAALNAATEGAVCFAEDPKALVDAGGPALVITIEAAADAVRDALPHAGLAVAAYPKAVFARLAGMLHQSLLAALPPLSGVADDARIASTAEVAPNAVVGPGALIHDDVVIGPGAVIGPGVAIGAGTVVGHQASVTHAVVGAACVLSAGVRVGEAGFGYAPDEGGAVAVPQLGRVVIGDAVDLGANTCVDRGALSDTVIGRGTKIDNLCQVGHGCQLGEGVLIASQTGLSGGAIIGDGAMIGGQVGMAERVRVGAGASVTAQAGLMRDVPPGERWGGSPARPARVWLRETAAVTRLAAKKDG